MGEPLRAPEGGRDPWVAAGVALLAIASLAVVLLYRAAPQSLEEARTQAWIAGRPNAYAPHLERARALLREAASASDERAAVTADSLAAEHAWRARELAEEPEAAAEATALWSRAVLEWAERLRRAGTGQGLRRDDNDLLRRSLALVDRVLAVAGSGPAAPPAHALRERLQRQLRPAPLEWLPAPR